MNSNQSKRDIQDFKREDDIWVRTTEEKGKALSNRYLQQTDQGNEEERTTLMRRLQYFYREDLSEPHDVINTKTLSKFITQAKTPPLDQMASHMLT